VSHGGVSGRFGRSFDYNKEVKGKNWKDGRKGQREMERKIELDFM
jgi:hypothetical protein